MNGNIIISNMILKGSTGDDGIDVSVIHYMLSFKRLCAIAVACPVVAIAICLLTAVIFQAEDVHETHCQVYNIIPSISAITGITPQIYLWRISIALHIGPRFIIAAVYKAYQENLINHSAEPKVLCLARKWLTVAYWLDLIEICSLCGVTYISNRENYPIHEKLFITFMISSLTGMLANIIATHKIAEIRDDISSIKRILTLKKNLFFVSIISAIGLVAFFLQHRLLCHNLAFSGFAFCEYIVASANMAFHVTVILDFPTEHLVVVRGLKEFIPITNAKLE